MDFVEGSILDTAALRTAFEGSDAIVHLAARPSVPRSLQDPRSTHEVNVTGTLNVLEAARSSGGIHTIIASSSSVYGANETLPKSEHLATRPMSPYAASKLAAEAYALSWSHSFDLPVLALRFFNVFGPLQRADHAYAAAIPKFIDALLSGTPIEVYGSGEQTRDFTYVGSVCTLITRAIEDNVHSREPVNCAFGSRTSLLELIALLSNLAGVEPQLDFRPARTGDVLHSQADDSHLRQLFPACRATDLSTGLSSTVEWFRSLRS